MSLIDHLKQSIVYVEPMRPRVCRLYLLLFFASLSLDTGILHAATWTVTDDGNDGPNALRSVVARAAPGDTIEFGVDRVVLRGAEIVLAKDLKIDGKGEVTVSNGAGAGHFSITATASVHLRGLILTGGHGEQGGSIRLDGKLLAENCTFRENRATMGGGALFIGATGTATITGSTFHNNLAHESTGGAIKTGGRLTIANTTFYQNESIVPMLSQDTPLAGGGAIHVLGTAQDTLIVSTTITSNLAQHRGMTANGSGILIGGDSIVRVRNIFMSGNLGQGTVGGDIHGTAVSLDFNYVDSAFTNFIGETAHNRNNVDGGERWRQVAIHPLADNGGPTQTMAPGSDSPLFGAGDCTPIPGLPIARDQRNMPRYPGPGCDIGAFERFAGLTSSRLSVEPPGPLCVSGGTKVELAADFDGDDIAEDSEIFESYFVCHDADDDLTAGSLIRTRMSTSCTHGGTDVLFGLDDGGDGDAPGTAGDGELDDSEVDAIASLCTREDDTGSPSDPVPASLIRTSTISSGEECEHGGMRFEAGLDDGGTTGSRGDGELDASEVDAIAFLCSDEDDTPPPPISAPASLIRTRTISPGQECEHGGVRIEAGLDDGENGGITDNGVLEDGEVDASTRLCSAAAKTPPDKDVHHQKDDDGQANDQGRGCNHTQSGSRLPSYNLLSILMGFVFAFRRIRS